MICFTSDLHLGHRGIIEMQNRPFENVEEMNRALVNNYNEVVHKNDTVYFLGDISHHMPITSVNKLLGMMKGKKILIKGNHDKKYDSKLFEEICDFKTVSLNGQYFALMHYPMLSWPKKNSGCFQNGKNQEYEVRVCNKILCIVYDYCFATFANNNS